MSGSAEPAAGADGVMGPSLVALLRAHARSTPDAFCLAHGEERLSFRDLDMRSNRVANALLDEGLVAGDRVAIIARTGPIFYELAYGCAKAGVVMMPLNWRLSAREIAAILGDAEPALLLLAAEFAPLVAGAAVPEDRILSVERGYDAWRDGAGAGDPERPIAAAAPTLLLYTSGTTGQPKGVMLTHRNLSYVGRMAGEAWGFTAASVNLVAMPLFHIGGIGYGMMALSQGGGTVLLGQPDPEAVVAAIRDHGVTHAFFVPSVIQRLVEHVEGRALSVRLERIIYGAAPIAEPVLRRALALFKCGFSHAYGMTETAGTVITLPPEDHDPDGPHKARLRACGKPLPWVELAIVDPATGAPTSVDAVGEIRVRSGMTMLGYWRKPEETAAVLSEDGWLCTGDAASRDADGYVYIQDRYKDMIVSGGENIYPTEVENVLQGHDAIAEVAVIGVSHERWGETPRAYVVLRPGAASSEGELLDYARSQLARYKCPTSVRFVASLPKTASGKITKAELRRLDRAGEVA